MLGRALKRRWILIVLAFGMGLFSLFPSRITHGANAKFTDIQRHWAQSLIEQAVEKGYVKGYEDGTFRPDAPVTAAEFVTMMLFSLSDDGKTLSPTYLNKVNKYFKTYNLGMYAYEPWQDDSPVWYDNYIRQGRILGMISSDDFGGDFDTKLKREDVAYLADNIVGLMFDGGVDHTVFELAVPEIKDFNRVSRLLTSPVLRTYYRGIMIGDEGGWFNPDRYVSRSEAVAVIERIHNEELRRPFKIDFSIYPHVVVKNDRDGVKRDVILGSEKAKQKYLDMVNVMEQSGNYIVHNGLSIMLFKDEDAFKMYAEQIREYTKWDDPSHYDAVFSIGEFGDGVVDISISTQTGGYDRVKNSVHEYIKRFIGNNSDALMALIDTVYENKEDYLHESIYFGNTKVMYGFESRVQVISFSIGSN